MQAQLQLFGLLKRLHDKSVNVIGLLSFDKQHQRHLNLVALYCSLIEFTGTNTLLIEKQQTVGVPIIYRSFLEAYVDFINLESSADYGYFMEANRWSETLKTLREANTQSNPFLQGISNLKDLQSLIHQSKDELNSLKNKGFRPLKVFERFEKAQLRAEYKSIYTQLSSETHSSILGLINRHIELDSNTDFSVRLYQSESLDRLLPIIDSNTVSLIDASLKIHKFLESTGAAEFAVFSEQLEEIRALY